MSHIKSYQSVVSCFHSAIDFEQENQNAEAYKKYAQGLSIIGHILQDDAQPLDQPNVAYLHKQLLEFAKRSIDRLLTVLQKFDDNGSSLHLDRESTTTNDNSLTTYRKLTETLPKIVTEAPHMVMNIPDEVPGVYSPLSYIEEDKKRIVRLYEHRIESLMNPTAKANLQLELERRLAENEAVAHRRYEDWEKRRKVLAEECHRIAEEKFYIREKIESGTLNESDLNKQNIYATCLQFHKEHAWAQEYSCKLLENVSVAKNVTNILNLFLQNGSYPLACILRQLQQKTTNKLSKLNIHQNSYDKIEKNVLEEHFKNIVLDTKEDLFMLTTVVQALWEPLNNEAYQLVIIDVLHHLYFLTVKPHFIKVLRILLHQEEEDISECMRNNTRNMISYPATLNSTIAKLHQLTAMHSPITMMSFLVDILRSLIDIHHGESSDDTLSSISITVDNMMPKLIQFILLSNMSTLPAEITFVENFMPAKKALGEEGYAVTLFQSVLSYIYLNCESLSSQ